MKSIGFSAVYFLAVTSCSSGIKIEVAKKSQISLKGVSKLKDTKSLLAVPILLNGIEFDDRSGVFSLDIVALDANGTEVQLSCEAGCPSDVKIEKDADSTIFSWVWKKETASSSFIISATNGTTTSRKSIQFKVPILDKCNQDAQTECITTDTYRSANLANLSAGNIKNGVTIAGVAGLYPSVLYPLPSASGTDLPSLAANVAAGTFQWWKQDGTRITGTISDASTVTPGATSQTFNTSVYKQFTVATDANLAAGNIKTGTTIFGIVGSVVAAPSDCNGNAQSGCVTTSTYKSADLTNLAATNIRDSITVAGVSGNLAPKPSDCGLDGQVGCVTVADFPAVAKASVNNGWNVRKGTTLGGISGQIQFCRNTINTGLYGTAGNKYSTIEDLNGGLSGLPSGQVTGWSNFACTGINWQDVSGGTGGSGVAHTACSVGPSATTGECQMRDNITELIWSPVQSNANWATAISTCDGLTISGVSAGTWRLPTQKELMQAYINGIRAIESPHFGTFDSNFWSSTSSTTENASTHAWQTWLSEESAGNNFKSSSTSFMCVRE